MLFDATEFVQRAWKHYDKLLDEKIAKISELSGVSIDKMVKINPAEFIEETPLQIIDGYEYKKIGQWLNETKTDDNYLISPLDDDELTANQISYKEHIGTERIRASKCKIIPIHKRLALQFFKKNHRQLPPKMTDDGISYGLEHGGQLVGVMTYDKTAGGIRGHGNAPYELLRLAFAHGVQVMGGASKLEKKCEQTLRELGETEIFSYSNATINTGKVYSALGFKPTDIKQGQPFVIMEDLSLVRLINLHPFTTNEALAKAGRVKARIGGNKTWTKEL